MAQRYMPGLAHERMALGLCPECGARPEDHDASPYFWERNMDGCDLLPEGVRERISQYEEDQGER